MNAIGDEPATPSASVLALIGDRYHNLDYIRVHFDKLFGALGVEYRYTGNYEWFADEELTSELLAGVRLFCVFRDGLTFPDGYIGPEWYSYYVRNLMDSPPDGASTTWVTEGFGRAVERFVRDGGSLFSCHNNLSVSAFSPSYRELTGGVYDGHPPERPWKVEVTGRDHPITHGMADFIVTDEQHFPIFDRDPSELLLRGTNTDGLTFSSDSGAVKDSVTSAVAWAHEYGRGRVVVSTIGHNLDALWKPDYWLFQTNAVRWLLRES
jgi:type 1 glutamine amidotransferase